MILIMRKRKKSREHKEQDFAKAVEKCEDKKNPNFNVDEEKFDFGGLPERDLKKIWVAVNFSLCQLIILKVDAVYLSPKINLIYNK